METYLNKLQKLPTSSKYLMKLLNNQVKIITYPELIKFNNIEELLYPYGRVIILYLQKENYGHWTCIFYQGKGKKRIEHFDSYGYFPDDELNFAIDPYFRKVNNMEYPLLTLLLNEAYNRYDMTFNQYKFQKKKKDISTCGRHCIVRLWYSDIELDEYKDMMFSTELTPDELVTMLTIS